MTTYGANVIVSSFPVDKTLGTIVPSELDIEAYSKATGALNSYYGYYGLHPSHFAGSVHKSGSVFVYRYQDTNSAYRI
jgi:hypothetical protein